MTLSGYYYQCCCVLETGNGLWCGTFTATKVLCRFMSPDLDRGAGLHVVIAGSLLTPHMKYMGI